MNDKLKPCPCCKGKVKAELVQIGTVGTDILKTFAHTIECIDCGVSVTQLTIEEAVKVWNRRPKDKEMVKKSRIRKVIQSEEFRHYFNTPISKKLEGIVGKKKEK